MEEPREKIQMNITLHLNAENTYFGILQSTSNYWNGNKIRYKSQNILWICSSSVIQQY